MGNSTENLSTLDKEIPKICSILLNTNRTIMAGVNVSEKLREAGCIENELKTLLAHYYLPKLTLIGTEERNKNLESIIRAYTVLWASQFGAYAPQDIKDMDGGKLMNSRELRGLIHEALVMLRYPRFYAHDFAPVDILKYQNPIHDTLVYCTDRKAKELGEIATLPRSTNGVKLNNDVVYRVFVN